MKNFFKWSEKLFAFLSASILIALLIILTWQVFSRYVLNSPSTVTEELSRLLLIVLTSFGTTLTFLQHQQLGLDLISEKATGQFKVFVTEFSNILIMLLGLLLIAGGMAMIGAKWDLDQRSAVLGFRQVYLYFLLPFCGFFIFLSPFNKQRSAD